MGALGGSWKLLEALGSILEALGSILEAFKRFLGRSWRLLELQDGESLKNTWTQLGTLYLLNSFLRKKCLATDWIDLKDARGASRHLEPT